MWIAPLVYLLIGLGYWLCSVSSVGLPAEVEKLPPWARRRVKIQTALLTVLLWPVALMHDLGRRGRD